MVCSAEQRVHDLGVFASVAYWLRGGELDEDEEDISK